MVKNVRKQNGDSQPVNLHLLCGRKLLYLHFNIFLFNMTFNWNIEP